MFPLRLLISGSILVAGALQSAPVFSASPRPMSSNAPRSLDKIDFAEESLETSWSFRGNADFAGDGAIRAVFGWKDAANFTFVEVRRAQGENTARWAQKRGGKISDLAAPVRVSGARGELGVQTLGSKVRVLWNGRVAMQSAVALSGVRFGTSQSGAAKLRSEAPQPTEKVVFRDDFMRADGPEQSETPGEWRVAGVWKTSGTLGPKSDAALNPNPFVFRAQGTKESVARAGKWWWNNYSVSASVRATRSANGAANGPLRAGIEAFAPQNGLGIRGEVDFARGLAILRSGNQVLAQAPCDAEEGQWHRMRLEPGPGLAKFWVDGVLAVQAPSGLAQGSVSLRAVAAPGAHVDFDDVRAGESAGGEWGEGALPEQFQKDRLMSNWASNAKLWSRDAGGTWWHSGDFFGASTLSFPLPNWKNGQGAAIFWGEKAALQAAPAVFVKRENDGYSLLIRGENGISPALPWNIGWKSAKGAILTFKLAPQTSGRVVLSAWLGGKKLVQGEVATPRGTKIGVRPLQNIAAGGAGVAWPLPALQKLAVSSLTFEREGRAVIGVNLTSVTPEIARQLGLPDALGVIVDRVEAASPAGRAGIREGDVIRGVDGASARDIDSMRAAVGAVKPGDAVKLEILRVPQEPNGVARPPVEVVGLDFQSCIATTPQVLDYSFTTAPIDWRAARGNWEIAERWTCSPQWSFFAGQNDAAPLLWSRFATKGDFTLEAYIATPMDLTRGERSPSDLNLVVGGDGREIASGYSFIFGGKNRSVNQVRRGDSVALEKPFEIPPGAGDVHQDWFYVRLERRQTAGGVRFKYAVNGREIADYTDKNPLADGGHLGFWTQSGALSIARVRLWHAGLREPKRGGKAPLLALQTPQKPISNALGMWSGRAGERQASTQLVAVAPVAAASGTGASGRAIQISNPRSGGDWTTYVTRAPFSLAKSGVLSFDYRVPGGVKVNLYAQIAGSWREIGFTGGLMSSDGQMPDLGQIANVTSDGTWRRARFDLRAALKARGMTESSVEALAFAAPDRDYLRAGIGGNRQGASFWVRGFGAS